MSLLSSRFEGALVFAAQLHREQLRKGTNIPYVAHLLAVASIALEHGADEDEASAALLHDAAEDQGGEATLAVIREKLGARVADIVEGCTDAVTIPMPPWRQRKAAYVARLPKASASVRLVSAADKLHNAHSILSDLYRDGEKTWTRFNGGKEGTLWYYRALMEAFRSAGASPLVEELDRVVTAMEQFKASQTSSREKTYEVARIRQEHPMAYAKWTTEDDQRLKALHHDGKSVAELAQLLHRNQGAIRSRLRKLGLLV
jgi:(p)ppGpp synthase/HD superfamily hydrolase